jgi:RoxA-like, cytochrome c-like
MHRKYFSSAMALALAAAAGAACGDGASAPEPARSSQNADTTNPSAAWVIQRTARQAAFDAYLVAHADEFESYKNTALGNLGVPMIMLRLFPEIFPDIWGPAEEHFASVGFAADPYEPWRVLPLGLGYAGSVPAIQTQLGSFNVNVVTLTCGGCHIGRVQGSDGTVHTIVGAPNTQFDGFRTAVYRTVNDPRYQSQNFLNALNAHPLGWVYGDLTQLVQEFVERQIFNTAGAADQFLQQTKTGSNFFAARWAATLGKFTYGDSPKPPDPSAPQPGYLDAIGAGITIVVDPTTMSDQQLQAVLPPGPAQIDIMSVWTQSARPMAQWDGSIPDHLHRNLAAEFGVVGDPAHVSMKNVDLTTPFTDALPAPPYPFSVDQSAWAEGKQLFGRYCSTCHYDGNASIFPPSTVGTDANRANIWSPYSVGALRQVLRAACTDPVACNPGGTPIPDSQIVTPTLGYMALPLGGIWARAPYLHNGSVPTLAALLVPSLRPAQFWRGNITYDETHVGFTSDKAVTPYAAIYDTTYSGNSNVGHDTPEFLGDIDWGNNPTALHSMLEYLKTL